MRSLRWFLAGLVAGAILAGFGAGWVRVVTAAQTSTYYQKYEDRGKDRVRCIFTYGNYYNGVGIAVSDGAC